MSFHPNIFSTFYRPGHSPHVISPCYVSNIMWLWCTLYLVSPCHRSHFILPQYIMSLWCCSHVISSWY